MGSYSDSCNSARSPSRTNARSFINFMLTCPPWRRAPSRTWMPIIIVSHLENSFWSFPNAFWSFGVGEPIWNKNTSKSNTCFVFKTKHQEVNTRFENSFWSFPNAFWSFGVGEPIRNKNTSRSNTCFVFKTKHQEVNTRFEGESALHLYLGLFTVLVQQILTAHNACDAILTSGFRIDSGSGFRSNEEIQLHQTQCTLQTFYPVYLKLSCAEHSRPVYA